MRDLCSGYRGHDSLEHKKFVLANEYIDERDIRIASDCSSRSIVGTK
jgi:hypothetical protein